MRRLLEGRIEKLGGEIAKEVTENIRLRAEIMLLEGKLEYSERQRFGSSHNPIYID